MSKFGVLVCCAIFVIRETPGLRLQARYHQHNPLVVTRCEASCWTEANKKQCVQKCLAKGADKQGSCPNGEAEVSHFDTVCLNACKRDSQCPGVSKCCPHRCGITCKKPQGLNYAQGLPSIPQNITITEGRRRRTLHVEWDPGTSSSGTGGGGTVLFLLEERHYSGQPFIARRMTDWRPCARTPARKYALKGFGKPGRWYQFRVSAVNGNGSRGWSEASTFSITRNPKPPKAPQNMTVGPLWANNGTIDTELKWSPPASDLPVQKYRVFWSRRLQGATVLDSVLVQQQVVPGDQTTYQLHDLQPKSQYFLQVQAIAQYGKEKLKGEKSAFVLNTTNYINITDDSPVADTSNRSRIEGLHLVKLSRPRGELRATMAWKARKGVSRYAVSWWKGPCEHRTREIEHLRRTAVTKVPNFDLFDLEYNCQYRVSVREIKENGMKSPHNMSVRFKTPSCYTLEINNTICPEKPDTSTSDF